MRTLVGTAALTTAAVGRSTIPSAGALKPWGASERDEWRTSRKVVRSYREEVLTKLEPLAEWWEVEKYGALSQDPERFPLYSVRSRRWEASRPSVLITGGVHGYETSGVQGALLFLQSAAAAYSESFNLLVVPCVSPWGYETIQRWNAQAVDPNRSFNPRGEVVAGRSFNPEAATEESAALLSHLEALGGRDGRFLCHIDLHETTDTDESEFRPAKAARDGVAFEPGTIPDGFYLVADVTNPRLDWHAAIIDAVRRVTHIAPADPDGTIIGEPVLQEGVIGIPSPRSLGLCAGATRPPYATTTEVYPDSPKADADICNRAQVAAITSALDFLLAERRAGGGAGGAAAKAEL
ncbi:hypothetical protein EMIHUDRAFT_452523 [Emiliania huxleyi CCMP1516]|uniref:Peptidase M14 domain-containing protein n=2 Tax=Emiliania huxleyi TaxID=2903 RepID=A0A0D3IIT6_EMIH1|nr:hypothetical protein EMIHUDRAFT_452523 [Emiliania huxleyi CCMP1516]EOD11171.1 hypothetical protein EMIHUDRAFT_452523 [Emiliania huxleyi CCMP1516]|eukprot:XP_005763600.1 hypothetical protein EMIHUDRAFT_452523 [Emiliania huxleyi CCMP1516]